MNSKPRGALVLALLLSLGSATTHAEVCDDLSWLLEHAATGFTSFDTRFKLEGANECEVTTGSDAEFDCEWNFADPAQATETYHGLVETARGCLAPEHAPGQEIVLSNMRALTFRSDSVVPYVTVRLNSSARRPKVSVHVYAE